MTDGTAPATDPPARETPAPPPAAVAGGIGGPSSDGGAEELIARLIAPGTEPIPGDSVRHFVRPDRPIRLGPEPEKEPEDTAGNDPGSADSASGGAAEAAPGPAATGPSSVETGPGEEGAAAPAPIAERPGDFRESTPAETVAGTSTPRITPPGTAAGGPADGTETTVAESEPTDRAPPATRPAGAPERPVRSPEVPPSKAASAGGDDGGGIRSTAPAPVPGGGIRSTAPAPVLGESVRHFVGADQPIRLGAMPEKEHPEADGAPGPAAVAASSRPGSSAARAGEAARSREPLAATAVKKPPTPSRKDTKEEADRGETVTLRELLEGVVEIGESDVFYVHSVTADDYQGIWGIIQKGITENFARGISIDHDGNTSIYRFQVPADADEVLENRSSSPLGIMIYRKSNETILYNRRLGRLTRDPDVTIYPGNELIIVGFKADEIVSLYRDFLSSHGR